MSEQPTASTPDTNPLRQNLPRARVPDPCVVVLFGASRGDLTALGSSCRRPHQLAEGGNLPAEYAIVGFARRDWNDDQLRDDLSEMLKDQKDGQFANLWPDFAKHIVFSPGTFDDLKAYEALKVKLEALDKSHGTRGNRLFYLAVAPEFFATIIEHLGKAGLIYHPQQDSPWSRVVIEKPFGHDLASAEGGLQRRLAVLRREPGLSHRPDLGKETVQNIMAARGSATRFSSRSGTGGTSPRCKSPCPRKWEWPAAGARITTQRARSATWFRTTCCSSSASWRWNPPSPSPTPSATRSSKGPAIAPDLVPGGCREKRRPHSPSTPRARSRGEEMPGYLQRERGPSPTRKHPPYVAMRLKLNTWRLGRTCRFTSTPASISSEAHGDRDPVPAPSDAAFRARIPTRPAARPACPAIQPNEGASLTFEAKIPGSPQAVAKCGWISATAPPSRVPRTRSLRALLLDVMLGDPTLYTRTDEVDSLAASLTTSSTPGTSPKARPRHLSRRRRGPAGPMRLIGRDGLKWRRLWAWRRLKVDIRGGRRTGPRGWHLSSERYRVS